MKRLISVTLFIAVLFASAAVPTNAVPYAQNMSINAVSYELPTENFEATLDRDFRIMSDTYGINAVSIYGLESVSRTNRSLIISTLKKYKLQLILRIESYDPESFAFAVSDVQGVISRYESLIRSVSQSSNRGLVSYFALNMPVDDANVQKNAGGLNSSEFNTAQVSYANELVRQMRTILNANGFHDAKLFLSVFYGWDNTYTTPSYASANADGYFLTNYSYPMDLSSIPNGESSDNELINTPRLMEAADRFVGQYGNSPFVVEYGFHTLDYSGEMPDQTAGLVADRKAKSLAIQATNEFYINNYEGFLGADYFGFNIEKREGNDNKTLDWMLIYPDEIPMAAAFVPKINNADFLSGKDGWGFTGAEENFKLPGDKTARLDYDSNAHDLFQSTAWFGYTTSKIDGLYSFSASVNTHNLSSGSVKFTVEFKNDDRTVLVYSSENIGKGKEQSVIVNIPRSAYGVYDEILFKAEITSGSGYIMIRNLKFNKINSVIFNGDFESGSSLSAASWGMWPDWNAQSFIDLNTFVSGRKSIKIELSGEQNYSVYSDIYSTEEAENSYYCSAKLKYFNASDKMQLRVNRGENNSVYSRKFDIEGNSNDFLTYAFKIPADKTAEYLQLQIELDPGRGTVWLDDFELVPSYEVPGDVNNDGAGNIIDLVALKKHAAYGTGDLSIIDINKSGFFSADDLVSEKYILLG